MKACLILQRRFAYIGHELAILLKEKHGVDEFCAYVFLRDSFDFLASQQDILYTKLVLDEDVQKSYENERLDIAYLEAFEKKYGSVWEFISVDRVIRYGQLVREYPHDSSPYTYEEMLRIVQTYAKHIEAFLDAEKPDFIFSYQPGGVGSMLLQRIAKKRGIPVLIIVFPMTKNLVSLSEDYNDLSWAQKRFGEYSAAQSETIPHHDEARAFIEEFRKKPVIYSTVYTSLIRHGRLKQFAFLSPRRILSSLYYNTWTIGTRWLRDAKRRSDYTTVNPLMHLWDRTKRKLRILVGADDLYDTYDPAKPFVFFPLHLEPEIAILLRAPFDTDQIHIAKRLARSLPAGMYLYVKDHPQMSPYRPRRYYRELKKIPNVKLLRPEISGFDVIKNAALIAVISGSAGWEASLMGKPVITFGDVFYNALPSVVRSEMPHELPAVVKKQLQAPFNEEALVRFLATLFAESARCDLLHLWEFETDRTKKRAELEGFAALIAQKARETVSKAAHKK